MVHLLTRNRAWLAPFLLSTVGFGVAAAALAVVNALIFKPLPYPHAERLYALHVAGPSWSPALFEAFAHDASPFSPAVGMQERSAVLQLGELRQRIALEAVSAGYFELLGVWPASGRAFAPDEDRRGTPAPVAIISAALAGRLPAPALQASAIDVDGRRLRVIGVMPPGFAGFMGRTDVWVPLASARWLSGDEGPERPSSRWFEVMARAPAALDGAQVQALFAAEAVRSIEAVPNGSRFFARATPRAIPLKQQMSSPVVRRAGWWLLGGAALLLTLIGANLAGLQLATDMAREHEVAIRRALGASDARLLREAAWRALVPLAAGLAAGLTVRGWILDTLLALRPPAGRFGLATADPFAREALAVDAPTGLALAVMFVVVWTLVASAPMLRARRAVLVGLAAVRRASWWRLPQGSAFLGAQIGIAACVVACSGVMLKSAVVLAARDRGFEPEGAVSVRISLPDRVDGQAATVAFYDELIERVKARPGISAAGVISCVPGGGRCRRSSVQRIDGRPMGEGERITLGVHFATPGAFAALGARLSSGRGFGPLDRSGSDPVVILSASAARRLWPGEEAIGRRVSMFFADGRYTEDRRVIGVVRDIEYDAAEQHPPGDVYFPARQAAWSGLLIVRTPARPETVIEEVARALQAVDPTALAFDAATLRGRLADGLANERFITATLAAFAAASLILSVIGTYAVTRVTLARRRRDIGITLALGASRRRICLETIGPIERVAALGACAGLTAAFWLVRSLATLAHDVAVHDTSVFALTALATLAAPGLAALRPVWRAARLNPLDVLRPSPL